MDDLIDRNELLDFLYELEKGSKTDDAEMAVKELIGYVASMPPAESQIIHCKDCMYKEVHGTALWCDQITGEPIMVKESDFCSWAEVEMHE